MKVENKTRQALMLNIGRDAEGRPKDVHLRARGYPQSSVELTEEEFNSREVQKLIAKKKLGLIG